MGIIDRPVMRRHAVTVRFPGASRAPRTRTRTCCHVGRLNASRNGASQAFRMSGTGSPAGAGPGLSKMVMMFADPRPRRP